MTEQNLNSSVGIREEEGKRMTYKQTILGAAYKLVYSYRPFTVVSEGGKIRSIGN